MDRGHTGRDCQHKRIFQTEADALRAVDEVKGGSKAHPSRLARLEPYYCQRHSCWHIGTKPTAARRRRLAKQRERRIA